MAERSRDITVCEYSISPSSVEWLSKGLPPQYARQAMSVTQIFWSVRQRNESQLKYCSAENIRERAGQYKKGSRIFTGQREVKSVGSIPPIIRERSDGHCQLSFSLDGAVLEQIVLKDIVSESSTLVGEKIRQKVIFK